MEEAKERGDIAVGYMISRTLGSTMLLSRLHLVGVNLEASILNGPFYHGHSAVNQQLVEFSRCLPF